MILLLLPYSCKGVHEGTIINNVFEEAQVDLDRPTEVPFSEIFQSAEVIPLETTKESLIADIMYGKVFLSDGTYYIHDVRQEAVLIFGSHGEFINKLRKKGRAPGEYTSLSDFQINPFSGNLELLDPSGFVHIYDSIGEKYINTIKTYRAVRVAHNFVSLTPDIWVFYYNESGNRIRIYSKETNKMLKEMYSLPNYLSGTPFSSLPLPFDRIGSSVIFSSHINGDVFTIDSLTYELIPRFKWDVGKYRFELSDLPPDEKGPFYMTFFEQENDRYAFNFGHVFGNQRFYVSTCVFRNQSRILFFDRQNKISRAIISFKEGVSCAYPVFMDELYLYAVVNPSKIGQYVNPSILDEENMQKIRALTEDSNPIILRYRFKE